jgi:hypothetical protein
VVILIPDKLVETCFAGLDLPGFLQGSNFLLPWDLPVHAERERWPTIIETTIIETTSKRGRHARRSTQKSKHAHLLLQLYMIVYSEVAVGYDN